MTAEHRRRLAAATVALRADAEATTRLCRALRRSRRAGQPELTLEDRRRLIDDARRTGDRLAAALERVIAVANSR